MLALAVLLWGGYVEHWSWTGFDANDTLWDWLQLLLLPVAVATLPIWLRHRHRMDPTRRRLLASTLALFAAVVLIGYVVPLAWTGFPGNTLWDWLQLVVLPVVVVALPIWAVIDEQLRPHHRALLWSALAGVVVLVAAGYTLDWGWTGFHGNTLWDWLELLLVPLVLPTILLPAALAWLGERSEIEAAAGAPEPGPARGSPPRRPFVVAPMVAALIALVALGAGTALGSEVFARHARDSASRPVSAATCDVPGASTVAADGIGRVFRAGARFYACRVGERPVALATRRGSAGPVDFRLDAARVAFADLDCRRAARGEGCSADIKVLRLGEAHPFVRQHFAGTGPVEDIAVTPGGALAIMLRERCAQGIACGAGRLYLIDANGTRVADAGPTLDTASLAQAGASVYWRHAGRVAWARLSG